MKAPSSSAQALEAAMSDEMRAALRELRGLLGVDHHEWPQVPALRVFQNAAAIRLAYRIQAEDGGGFERALARACGQLGIKFDAPRLARYRASSVIPRST